MMNMNNNNSNHTPHPTPRQRSMHHGDARFEHHSMQPPQHDSVFGRSSSQRQHLQQQGFTTPQPKVNKLMLKSLGISIIAFSAVTLFLNIKVHNESLRNTVYDTYTTQHQLRNFYRPHKKEDHLNAANAALLVASRQSSSTTKVDDDGDGDDVIFEKKSNLYNAMKAELNQLRLEMETKLKAEQSGLREQVRQQDRIIDALTRALHATLKNENENNSGNGDTSERQVVSGDSASEEDIQQQQQQQRTRLSGSNTTDTISMQHHHSVEDEGSNQRGIESHLPLLSTHNNSNSLSNTNSTDALPQTLTRKPSRYTDGLEFIHIPKAAGGSIEKAAANAGIKYGACHWVKLHWQGCNKGDWNWGLRLNRTRTPYKWSRRWEKPIGALWHVPSHWFKDDHNPYQNKTLFAVVRNPYERVVSEFFYRCKSANQLQDSGLCNDLSSETMNAFIQNQSWPCLHGKQCKLQKDVFATPQGHLIPQYDYVYDMEGNQMIDHILRFEHLNDDFSALMTLYDLPIRLPGKTKIHARNNNSTTGQLDATKMTVANLTKETIDVINKVYDKDFAAFNYLKVSSPDDFTLD